MDSSFLARALALTALACTPACFDGEELTRNKRCNPNKPVCGGDLVCRVGFDEYGQNLGYVCSTPDDDAATSGGSVDAGVTADDGSGTCNPLYADCSNGLGCCQGMCVYADGYSNCMPADPGTCNALYSDCSNGQGCCEGVCVNFDGYSSCMPDCGTGQECETCCCTQLQSGTRACVDTHHCGQEAFCDGGCASPGAACTYDGECCYGTWGGRCLENQGGWSSCFKVCQDSWDCASGCCNYYPALGQSICEQNCP